MCRQAPKVSGVLINYRLPRAATIVVSAGAQAEDKIIWASWGADGPASGGMGVFSRSQLHSSTRNIFVCSPGISKRDDADINTAFD